MPTYSCRFSKTFRYGPSVKIPERISIAMHALAEPIKRRALEHRAAFVATDVRMRIPFRHLSLAAPCTVIAIHKLAGAIHSIDANLDWMKTRHGFSTAWRRLSPILDVIADPAVADNEWMADLGDFVQIDGPVIGFCSNRRESLLVPDRGFSTSSGYRRERIQAAAAPAFDDRDPAIVWRGSATGQGHALVEPLTPDRLDLNQRVRMCLLLRGFDERGVDVRISPSRASSPAITAAYRRAGIAGGPVPQSSWSGRRFAIDIDGHANAYSNLFIRLIYGCCVIKVASPLGFRQWYYDRLIPWEHFVPVAADLTDLMDILAWCRSHTRRCREIAAARQRLAMAMTPLSERSVALRAFRGGTGDAAHDGMVIPMWSDRGHTSEHRRRHAA